MTNRNLLKKYEYKLTNIEILRCLAVCGHAFGFCIDKAVSLKHIQMRIVNIW